MTAEGKDGKRIACYGDKIVVLENKEIKRFLIIDEEKVKKEINSIIDNRETVLDLYHIFRKCMENITGYAYYGIRNPPVINGVRYSIHDQEIFKKYKDFILENEVLKREHSLYEEALKKKREREIRNRIVLGVNNPNFDKKRYASNVHKRR